MSLLAGRRIVLTRAAEDCEAWEAPLVAAGATVTCVPCIRTTATDDDALRRELTAALARADWLVVTSRRGVDALLAIAGRGAVPATTRIAVVGPATAAAAEAGLGRADLTGTGGTAAALAAEIVADPRFAPGQHCVAALAANAGPVIERTLTAAGGQFRRFDVYRTVPMGPQTERRSLAALHADAVVFSSPSTVAGFLNQVEIDTDLAAFSIGPSTSAALAEAGLAVAGEARTPGIDGIIAIIAERGRVAGTTRTAGGPQT